MNALPQITRPLPYYGTLIVFDRLMDKLKTSGLPHPINAPAIIALGMKSEEAYRLVSGFRSMGWTDEGDNPSDDLKAMVEAYKTEAWPSVLRSALQRAYSFVPTDWDTLTPETLRRAFVSYIGRDIDAVKSAETFFLAAATEAGVSLSVAFSNRVRLARPKSGNAGEVLSNVKLPKKLSILPEPPQERRVFLSHSQSDQFMDQILDLIALADDAGMSAKEREAILVVAAYLRRRSKGGAK
jgi:hypothetical protein